jgi:hypothetical protein
MTHGPAQVGQPQPGQTSSFTVALSAWLIFVAVTTIGVNVPGVNDGMLTVAFVASTVVMLATPIVGSWTEIWMYFCPLAFVPVPVMVQETGSLLGTHLEKPGAVGSGQHFCLSRSLHDAEVLQQTGPVLVGQHVSPVAWPGQHTLDLPSGHSRQSSARQQRGSTPQQTLSAVQHKILPFAQTEQSSLGAQQVLSTVVPPFLQSRHRSVGRQQLGTLLPNWQQSVMPGQQ